MNAGSYTAQLYRLHDDYTDALSDCAHDTIVTTHQAFSYMVQRYGINIQSVGGLHGDLPTTGEVVSLVEFVKENHITHILADSRSDNRAVSVLAEETGAGILTLDTMEYKEPGDTTSYVDRMYNNLDTLRTALACN